MSQDDLFQVQRPEVGRPTDRRVDSEFLAGRPELRGLRPFDPTRDVDLTDEINRVAANLRAEIASKAVSTPAWAISSTTENPRAPEQEELDANEVIHGSRLTASGAVQPLTWEPHTRMGQWVERGEPTATVADVQATQVVATEAKEAADNAKSVADTAQSAANALLASLTLTRPQLLSGTADPGNVRRIWDEHGSLTVRAARAGETPDGGITFRLAGGRMAEREWDGKNVYTKWYGLKPGDDVSGYIPALAAVPEGGVLHWTPGKYMHSLAGYAGKGDTYNPLHIRGKNKFTMKMAGVVVEAAPDLPNTTYYGGWAFYGCSHYRVEGWPVYDGRLDVRDAQQFHERYHNDPVTGVWGPDTSSPKRYSDPGWALLWLDGWRVELGCVGSYLEVEARRCLMDGILTVGNCVDTYLYRCVSSGNLRQGLSAVGVDGLTIDGGIYELTGQTRGPGGQRRGAPPFAGIDLEGEAHGGANDTPLMNKRVKIINKPEFRYNRGAGLMTHQYSENTQVESAHVHHNDSYGLNVDGASVGSYFGPGVLLEMNGRERGPGAESFEVNFHGAEAILNGVTIVTDAERAINDGAGKKGKKILNVTVKSVASDNSRPSGWVALFNSDTLVDGLTTENVVPKAGYGAVHVENLTTGTIRNSRIRTTLDTDAPGIGGKALSARNNEVVGYRQGDKVAEIGAAPVLTYSSGDALSGYTAFDAQQARLIRSSSGGTTHRITLAVVWDKKATAQTTTLYIGSPTGWRVTAASNLTLLRNSTGTPFGTAYPKSYFQPDYVTLTIPAFPEGETGLIGVDFTVDVDMVRA